jgi:4-hydroxy-2-oxoheptanedioate aldolase
VGVQIETRAGVDASEEIAAVPGLDFVFVGPGDLSLALGVAPGSEEHSAAIRRVLRGAGDAGVTTGIFCFTADQVAGWREAGVRLFIVGSDLTFLGSAGATAADRSHEG